jgi:hypothetical protein
MFQNRKCFFLNEKQVCDDSIIDEHFYLVKSIVSSHCHKTFFSFTVYTKISYSVCPLPALQPGASIIKSFMVVIKSLAK